MRVLVRMVVLAVFVGVSPAGWAAVVNGTFSGTLVDGTDGTGAFGAPGADLTGDALTGAYAFDTSMLTPATAGTVETGTGPGALTVTLKIGGRSLTILDNQGASVSLDSSTGEFTLSLANAMGDAYASFQLDAVPASNGMATGYERAMSTTQFVSSLGSFVMTAGDSATNGDFTLTSLSQAPAGAPVPEPGSLVLVASGLAGLVGAVRRKRG